jgi:hypothetical protein
MADPQITPDTTATIQRLPPELGASLLDTWWHARSDPSYAQLIQCLNAYLDERAPVPNVALTRSPTESTKNALLQIVLGLREHPGYAGFIAKLGSYLDQLEAAHGDTRNGVHGYGNGYGNGVDQDMMAAEECPVLQNGYINGAPQTVQNGVGGDDATIAAGVKRPLVDVDGASHAAEYAGQTKKERLG